MAAMMSRALDFSPLEMVAGAEGSGSADGFFAAVGSGGLISVPSPTAPGGTGAVEGRSSEKESNSGWRFDALGFNHAT